MKHLSALGIVHADLVRRSEAMRFGFVFCSLKQAAWRFGFVFRNLKQFGGSFEGCRVESKSFPTFASQPPRSNTKQNAARPSFVVSSFGDEG
eukprot:365719-Chlamydomonas_euryale.AAC.7